MLVEADRLGGFQTVEVIAAEPAQDAAGPCLRDSNVLGDLPAAPALAPQRLDPYASGS